MAFWTNSEWQYSLIAWQRARIQITPNNSGEQPKWRRKHGPVRWQSYQLLVDRLNYSANRQILRSVSYGFVSSRGWGLCHVVLSADLSLRWWLQFIICLHVASNLSNTKQALCCVPVVYRISLTALLWLKSRGASTDSFTYSAPHVAGSPTAARVAPDGPADCLSFDTALWEPDSNTCHHYCSYHTLVVAVEVWHWLNFERTASAHTECNRMRLCQEHLCQILSLTTWAYPLPRVAIVFHLLQGCEISSYLKKIEIGHIHFLYVLHNIQPYEWYPAYHITTIITLSLYQ